MAEKVVSPGVFTNEIDASFLPAAIGDIGAVVIGPTLKGPAMVPTVVNSMAEFEATFGTTFRSGSNYFQYLTSHTAEQYLQNGGPLTVVRVSNATPAEAQMFKVSGSATGDVAPNLNKIAQDNSVAVTFETIGDGLIYNNFGSGSVGVNYTNHSGSNTGTNDVLLSGSADNYRVEISGVNASRGTFNVSVRSGGDTSKRKSVLETFNNVSLDPNSNNYVARVIGNQDMALNGSGTSEPYIKPTGEFPVKSKYIRVKTVHTPTPNYLDENGAVATPAQSASLPANQSGSFLGAGPGVSGFDLFGTCLLYTSDAADE